MDVFRLIWCSKQDKKIDILWRSPLENSGMRPSQVVAGPWIVALRSRSNKIYIPGTRNLPQSRRLISSQFGCKNSCCYFPPPNSPHLPQMSALPVCTANASALQTHTQPVTKEDRYFAQTFSSRCRRSCISLLLKCDCHGCMFIATCSVRTAIPIPPWVQKMLSLFYSI